MSPMRSCEDFLYLEELISPSLCCLSARSRVRVFVTSCSETVVRGKAVLCPFLNSIDESEIPVAGCGVER